MSKRIVFTYWKEMPEGEEEVEASIPAMFEVCGTCKGSGTTVNPAIDGNGLTQEDFDEDPDFRENYMSGMYDVPCAECGGKRVVAIPDESSADPELLAKYREVQQQKAEWAREDAAARRWGY